MIWSKKEINEYLFYEFGYSCDYEEEENFSLSDVSDDWPFRLREVGTIKRKESEHLIFQFEDHGEHGDESYYVIDAEPLGYYPVSGMSIQDVQYEVDGSSWIEEQNPISLSLVILDDDIPGTPERRNQVKELASKYYGDVSIEIHDIIYFREKRTYLALIRPANHCRNIVLGTEVPPLEVKFNNITTSSSISHTIGMWLANR